MKNRMGILITNNPEEDQQVIKLLAVQIAQLWNDTVAETYGFKVYTSQEGVRRVSEEGGLVLQSYFPAEPGAFKRLATLLVTAQLTPLFSLVSTDSTIGDLKPVMRAVEREWLPRICTLLIRPTLSMLRVVDAKSGKEHALDQWQGFPSIHSKAEFLLWLEWLRDYEADKLDVSENLTRRGRMVLGTALVLEMVYYQSTRDKSIIGLCDKSLGDITCGIYEARIWERISGKS